MANSDADSNMALFCDFENVARGVEDAKIPKFDMQLVLERLLRKGSIVVKKAYCDWDRFKTFKPTMHQAAFELIEIPHTRQSGKNSADIRMVVDALDLCYTKEHIDTFVIISGDSDFSPLVSKLRENDKMVIGVGVRNSTSDLLKNNCDEFILYDDLVREKAAEESRRKPPAKKSTAKASPGAKKPAEAKAVGKDAARRDAAVHQVVETAEELLAERGGRILSTMIKQTIKRRQPDYTESAYGFRSFSELLEEAQTRGLLELEKDKQAGGYAILAVHLEA